MRVRRGDLHDVHVEDGRSAVMVGEQVLVLSEVATAILQAVPEHGSADVEDVAARVEAELGAPEPPHTALELVHDQVAELAAHHVLVLDHPAPAGTSTPDAVDAVRDALRHVLSDDVQPWRLPRGVTGGDLVAAAEQHHVVSFLHLHRERLQLPAGAAAALHAVAAQRSAAVDVLAGELSDALEALGQAGVRVLVVKGLALAAQAHGDLYARGAGDLDLLVAPGDTGVAHAALLRAGWVHDPAYPAPGPSWAWRHLLRTGHELSLSGRAAMIDLHWQLAPSHGTFPRFDVLWERRSVVPVGSIPVPTLSPYDALAHSASHAAKDRWRWLRSLVDVQLLASDALTWRAADRQLRHDQLISVGLAALLFGASPDAPDVVRQAEVQAADVWHDVLARQSGTASVHVSHRVPGVALANSVRTLRLERAGPADAIRQLGFSLIPPWALVEEGSPHAHVAAPRALWRRGAVVVRRLR